MFEKFLQQTPFVRFVVPLITGILLKIYFPAFSFPFHWVSISCFILIVIMEIIRLSKNIRLNWIFGALVTLFILSAGATLVQIKLENKTYLPDATYLYKAIITENPEIKENSIKAVLTVTFIKGIEPEEGANIKILAYFEKDSLSANLKMGDMVIVKSQVNEIKHSGNPYAFNFKRYMAFQEVYYQSYIKKGYCKIIDHNQGNKVLLLANKVRQSLLNQYKKFNIQGNEFAVLSALTLGYKADLSPEIKQSFSASGAMHVLAVSGLHVGIIFFIISKLLFFLERKKYGRIARVIIILISLFTYAIITGLSSSVLRSTFMFSLMCIGDIFVRQKNTYNTIAASAFILLVINPLSIMDVGFQLSYLAVISIVFFQPLIYSLLELNSYLPDRIWQLISVSVAAQIGTLPVTLYYFHQFPVYFVITNIIVIPLSLFIICSAVALLIFSFSTHIAGLIAFLLNLQLKIFNGSVNWIESLPASTIKSVFIDVSETLFLFTFILFISFFIITYRNTYLKISTLIVLVFVGFNSFRIYKQHQESGFIVYNIAKTSAIEYYSGTTNQLYINKNRDETEKLIQFNFRPFWDKQNIKKPDIRYASWNNSERFLNFYSFHKLKIAQIFSDKINNYEGSKKLTIDYLIISNGINLSVRDLQKYIDFKNLIIDSSNPLFKVNNWIKESEMLGINCHPVALRGAFVFKNDEY